MSTVATKLPVRWLVISRAALDSIGGFWREEFGADSILADRLDQNLIEASDIATLGQRLEALPRGSTKSVVLLFDRVDEAAFAAVDVLSAPAVQGLELRLAGFCDDPLAIVMAMNSSLLVDEDGFDVEESPNQGFAVVILRQAAASMPVGDDKFTELRETGPQGEELRFTHVRRASDGKELLKLQVDAGAIDRYRGRRVTLNAGGHRYALGLVLEDGIAQTTVDRPVNLRAGPIVIEVE